MLNVLSMRDAMITGRTRYFTGRPCPKGHIVERIVSTRACSACAAARKQAWNATEPEKRNVQKRRWRDANIERARKLNLCNQKLHRDSANGRQHRWLEQHRAQSNAASKSWAIRNPDRVSARGAKHRAAKLQQTPKWADQEAIALIYRAAAVIRISGFDVHVDHSIPLQGRAVRGLHVHNNLVIIDATRNRAKSNHF